MFGIFYILNQKWAKSSTGKKCIISWSSILWKKPNIDYIWYLFFLINADTPPFSYPFPEIL